jgi:hypothetical protein
MTTTKVTQKSELMETLYSEEIENINACILEGKESIYEKGRIEVPFNKVFDSEKKYTHYNLIQIADIFESYSWYVKVIESDEIFDFS